MSWSTDPDEERIYEATICGLQSAAPPSGQPAMSGQAKMDVDLEEACLEQGDGVVGTASGLGLLAEAASRLESMDA